MSRIADILIEQALSGLIEAENMHELRLRSRMLPERKTVRLMEKKVSPPDAVGQDTAPKPFKKKHEKDCPVFGEFVKEEEKKGYVLRTFRSSSEGPGYAKKGDKGIEMTQAYTPTGGYLGPEKEAKMFVKRGIAPEVASKDHNVCSIGYCEKEDKWYGWSHRAICGFGVGDMIFKERFKGADDHTPFVKHGDKPIKTMADAKVAAKRFANSVS